MLTIEHLTKHYPGTEKGITDLTIHAAPGDLYAFIGPNGAGKTTTLKAAAGLHGFQNGEIRIDGISLRDQPLECKKKIAYLPDNPDLYDYMTGIQFLHFTADIFKIPTQQRKEKMESLAHELGIEDALGDLIGTYSHGMKQKLALVAALIHEPKLLILDEPFVGLDPQAVFAVKGIMHAICEGGGAVFFSTHVLEVAEKLCNKVAILKDGRLVAEGPMEEVLAGAQSLEDLFMEVVQNDLGAH